MAGKITVVGLGAGDMDQLTLGVYKQLKQAKEVFMENAGPSADRRVDAGGSIADLF